MIELITMAGLILFFLIIFVVGLCFIMILNNNMTIDEYNDMIDDEDCTHL